MRAKRNPAEALTLQLLEWIEAAPRTHADAIEVWRTSCPRLSIWEDACIDGLVDSDAGGRLCVSARGRALLRGKPATPSPRPAPRPASAPR